MSRTRGLAPTNWAETVWPALKVDDSGTSTSTSPNLRPMPGLSQATPVWTTAMIRQWDILERVQVRTDVPEMILRPMSSREEQGLTVALLRPSHRPPGMTQDWNTCRCRRRGYLWRATRSVIFRNATTNRKFTRSEESRSAFITLDAIFLNCRNVVRVCVGRPRNNHVRVVPNDAIRDQPSPNRVSVQMKPCMSHAPVFILRTSITPVAGDKTGSSDIPYPSACHRRQFSRDDQDNEVANTEHLYVHGAGGPFVWGMRISLE